MTLKTSSGFIPLFMVVTFLIIKVKSARSTLREQSVLSLLGNFKLNSVVSQECLLSFSKTDKKCEELRRKRPVMRSSAHSVFYVHLILRTLYYATFKKTLFYLITRTLLEYFNLEDEKCAVLTNQLKIFSVVQEQEYRRPMSCSEASRITPSARLNRHNNLALMAADEILPVRAVMHSLEGWECSAVRDLWATAGPLQFPCLPAGGSKINNGYWQKRSQQKLEPTFKKKKKEKKMKHSEAVLWNPKNLLAGKHVEGSLQVLILLA